jgi:diadenosine tetraphosphatase ApaH/serine/threonine PP2A family protein phosphatase
MKDIHGIIQSILQGCRDDTSGSRRFATFVQVTSVISQVVEILSAETALLVLSGEFTIVGDIHGDILSLIQTFQELGWPDARCYVFLGDYVNRGDCSCEVLVLLYCLKILFPRSIFLLRGNHEFEEMTDHYRFRDECIARFQRRLYFQFVKTFQALPIAAILNDNILCVHGGITPELADLGSLVKISHRIMASLEMDILWSDPRADIEGFEPSPRGQGCLFGIAAYDSFLQKSGLTMMIRAHEECADGFNWPFGTDGKLLTVFSARNYCGKGNDGAVAVVIGKEVTIVRFPFKKCDKPRILIPFFILEAIEPPMMEFAKKDDASHLCVEIY